MKEKISICWIRRDLRLHDHTALYHALTAEHPVLPLFIFDEHILEELPKDDKRVAFLHRELLSMQTELHKHHGDIRVMHGTPELVWKQLLEEFDIQGVFFNRDYEPYARERDDKISQLLREHDVSVHDFKDSVILEKDEVLKDNGDPYVVFTPYSKAWKAKLTQDDLRSYPSEEHLDNLKKGTDEQVPTLKSMGFQSSEFEFPGKEVPQKRIKNYDKTRNFPGQDGTSRLGIHFRFGTISIREKARKAKDLNDTYFKELIWREFYQMILWHFPRVVIESFRPEYDQIEWRNNEAEFEAWKVGKTGYPIVDAGMRELNETGYMHNRVRMIVASFLTKHLLIDWRWGEQYFALKLLDYDLASNNGGWQWAAGSGVDAAPYFRVFNPELQTQKFDKDHTYIKKWVPEWGTNRYPKPIVEHKFARQRCLETYKKGLK